MFKNILRKRLRTSSSSSEQESSTWHPRPVPRALSVFITFTFALPDSKMVTGKAIVSLQVATIEQLPRGTAFNAARTPVARDVRAASFSNEAADSDDTSLVVSPNSKTVDSTEMARRAARRVSVWKKSEQERREEGERARQAKQEQDKRRQNHAVHAKQRRRAEIYALNALLRQLQQEKIARFIAAQTQIQEAQKDPSLASMTAALLQVEAVGV